MTEIKALIFDVGGTVFDWKSSVIDHVITQTKSKFTYDDAAKFSADWRAQLFKFRNLVAEGHMAWINSDQMLLAGLNELSSKYEFIDQLDSKQSFIEDTWHCLNIFEQSRDAIKRLRSKYIVIVLTVLSWQSVVKSSKQANIEWDGILSCEFLGVYKPSLQAYRKAISLIGIDPAEAMMIASHETDLAAAKTAGLKTAHVSVPEEDDIFDAPFVSADAFNFDFIASNFKDLCKQLDC